MSGKSRKVASIDGNGMPHDKNGRFLPKSAIKGGGAPKSKPKAKAKSGKSKEKPKPKPTLAQEIRGGVINPFSILSALQAIKPAKTVGNIMDVTGVSDGRVGGPIRDFLRFGEKLGFGEQPSRNGRMKKILA